MKKSERETITQSEYLQVIGLLTLAKNHNRQLRDIERAALNILQEVDTDGKLYEVWGGGFVGEAISGDLDAAVLMERLGIKVEESENG